MRWIIALALLTSLPLDAEPVAAFDIETTGFSPQKHRIVEIAAIRFDGEQVLNKKSWLVNPGHAIPQSATAIHGISTENLKDVPGIAAVLPEFFAFIEGATLIAHNARFDWGFILAEARRNDIAMPQTTPVDTLKLSRKWWPDAENHRLQTLADALGIEAKVKHRALADADVLRQVWLKGQGLGGTGPAGSAGPTAQPERAEATPSP